MKRLNELNNFSLNDMDDSGDMGSDDLGDDDSSEDTHIDVELVDCPVCRSSMISEKNAIYCPTCSIRYLSTQKTFQCGRKCFILDCGEVRPSGICENKITKENNWKCNMKTHKDDKNGEENFLETMM